MKRLRLRLGLPLLGKELTEQAARKRTYVIRAVYAALLFAVFGFMFHEMTKRGFRYGWQVALGSGRQLLDMLFVCHFFGISLFLPAMMSGTVAAEKENASMGLLFLTDMSPWELLIQKYLGRLIPMFSFLLLSLPLMGVIYALGGVDVAYLKAGVLMLLLTCLQVGAFALMASAFCSTVSAAFLVAYVGLAGFYFLPVLVLREEEALCCFPPFVFFDRRQWGSVGDTLPIAISTFVFLLFARVFLVRRAFLAGGNPLVGFFKALDRVYTRWNARLGGMALWRQDVTLPDEEPVAWREVQRSALGQLHHQCRIGLALEVPVLLMGIGELCIGPWNRHSRSPGMVTLVAVLWILAALTLTVQGASAIASERTRQTLDVLLTTPLDAADIVRQKLRALGRLAAVFAVPLLSMIVLAACLDEGMRRRGALFGPSPWSGVTGYLVVSLLSLAVYLPLVSWVSVWIGLKARTRFRAIATAVGAMVGWCVVPLVLAMMLGVLRWTRDEFTLGCVCLLSPATAIGLTETVSWRDMFHGVAPVMVVLNFLLYGALLYLVRRDCLRNADRYLRRG